MTETARIAGRHQIQSVGPHARSKRDSPARNGISQPGWPLAEPIVQSAAYAFVDGRAAAESAAAGQPLYARDGLPNVTTFERLVAGLEGAEDAVAVASGMAAVSLTLLSLLDAGDLVVTARDAYPETRELISRHLRRFGIEVAYVDPFDLDAVDRAMSRRPKLVLVETISNPGMRLTDLPTIAERAHRAGALVCVDNTFASPALCRPLQHGADLVLQSAGKLLAGHHDVTAGVVAGSHRLIGSLRADSLLFGATLAPMEAWLAVRGIQTLAQRMAWVGESAARIVPVLEGHRAVARVFYPGAETTNDVALIRALLPRGAGGLLAIEFESGHLAAERFIAALARIPYAATVGGPTTTVSYPPVPRHAGADRAAVSYACATVRLSLGLEDPDDLIIDLRQALDASLDI
jgi:cystathionine beta-lyase/cystathionine gamma-synthase